MLSLKHDQLCLVTFI